MISLSRRQTKCLAATAIICGACLWFGLTSLCAQGAIVFGVIVLFNAHSEEVSESDKQMACYGVALGVIVFIGFIVVILLILFYFVLTSP